MTGEKELCDLSQEERPRRGDKFEGPELEHAWQVPGAGAEREDRTATGTEGHAETHVPTSALGAPFCCHAEYEAGLGALRREHGGRRKTRVWF